MPKGIYIRKTVGGFKGHKHTERTKKIISEKNKGKRPSPETEIKKGQRLSPETEFKKGMHSLTEFKKGMTGSKCVNWKGGKSKRKRSGAKFIEWRTEIFQRDDWTCQVCDKKGIYVEAHHIKSWAKFPKLRFNVNNGVTLCKECHRLANKIQRKKEKEIENDARRVDHSKDS